jgi:hypothetical protein
MASNTSTNGNTHNGNGNGLHTEAAAQSVNDNPEATPLFDAAPPIDEAPAPLDVASVTPPPARGAPSVPKGFDKSRPGRGGRLRIQRSQLACASMVSSELSPLEASNADFGPHIPNLPSLGVAMRLAAQWSAERAKADAWVVYSRSQERLAWLPVLDALASFRPAFEHALNHDPSIAARYPSMALFYGIGSQSAKKAGRTRRARKSANAKAPATGLVKAP